MSKITDNEFNVPQVVLGTPPKDSVAELRRKSKDPYYQTLTQAERDVIEAEMERRYLERTPPKDTDIYSFLPSSRVTRGEMRGWINDTLGAGAAARADFDAPLALMFRLFVRDTCKRLGEQYR